MTVEKKTKEGIIVCKVDRDNKYYEYVFNPKGAHGKVIKKLIFSGYTKKPTSKQKTATITMKLQFGIQ